MTNGKASITRNKFNGLMLKLDNEVRNMIKKKYLFFVYTVHNYSRTIKYVKVVYFP